MWRLVAGVASTVPQKKIGAPGGPVLLTVILIGLILFAVSLAVTVGATYRVYWTRSDPTRTR